MENQESELETSPAREPLRYTAYKVTANKEDAQLSDAGRNQRFWEQYVHDFKALFATIMEDLPDAKILRLAEPLNPHAEKALTELNIMQRNVEELGPQVIAVDMFPIIRETVLHTTQHTKEQLLACVAKHEHTLSISEWVGAYDRTVQLRPASIA